MTTPAADDALPLGRFEGPGDFARCVRAGLQCAAEGGWRELILSDASFHDWPLGERAVIASLEQWARSGRRLTLLACEYDTMARCHPRFVRWRVQFDHLVSARQARGADPLELPSALWSGGWVLQRIDPLRSLGVADQDAGRRLALRQLLDEWLLRKSQPGFAASVLGL